MKPNLDGKEEEIFVLERSKSVKIKIKKKFEKAVMTTELGRTIEMKEIATTSGDHQREGMWFSEVSCLAKIQDGVISLEPLSSGSGTMEGIRTSEVPQWGTPETMKLIEMFSLKGIETIKPVVMTQMKTVLKVNGFGGMATVTVMNGKQETSIISNNDHLRELLSTAVSDCLQSLT